MSRTTNVDFESPPVVEIVCGAVFEPVEDFRTAHIGLLWTNFVDDFPDTQDMLPLQQRSGETITIDPRPRVWFVSEDEQRVIQVQRDRFHFNWRRPEGGPEYPRFEPVYASFSRHYQTFREFLAPVVDVQAQEYELTYVNHIDLPDESTPLGRILPELQHREKSEQYLPRPVGIQWAAEYELAHLQGRLRIVAKTGTKAIDGESQPILSLDLTFQGVPQQPGLEAMEEWFDGAHEAIVHGFVDLTSEEFQNNVWKRRV